MPLRVISHSKGAQVSASPPSGFGGGDSDATEDLTLLLISFSMSSDAPAALSFSICSADGVKLRPRA